MPQSEIAFFLKWLLYSFARSNVENRVLMNAADVSNTSFFCYINIHPCFTQENAVSILMAFCLTQY
jgi:hypothetical protein